MEAYNYYLIIGGMPECVVAWMESKDPRQVSQIQEELITVYENDFSKHNGKINSGRILMVFRSIVTQLAKENEKFIYGVVKEGARAREFEEAVEPRYYSTSREEIDFIVQHGMEIVPIEVKAGTDKSAASFKNYIKKEIQPMRYVYQKENIEKMVQLPIFHFIWQETSGIFRLVA